MATNYYKPYEIYDISLSKGTGIVQSASSLKSSCANYSKTIKSNFINKISNTNWSEEGKKVVESNILPGLESNIQGLTDFISNNLYKACDISINHLLPKVIMIKEKNIELDETEKKLIKTKNDLDTLTKQEPSATITDVVTGKEIVNAAYEEWVTEFNTLTTTYNELVTRFNNLESLLKSLCQEVNNLIANILSLNGNLSAEEISAMLPSIDSVDQSNYDYLLSIDVPFVDNNFFDESGQLILPEGFEVVDKKEGSLFYGIVYDESGNPVAYVEKVSYDFTYNIDSSNGSSTSTKNKTLTGVLYIPMNNSTNNLGVIFIGDDGKYDKSVSYGLQANEFDSVVFVPNTIENKVFGSAYSVGVVKAMDSIMEQYGLTTTSSFAHSNGCTSASNVYTILDGGKVDRCYLDEEISVPNFSYSAMYSPSMERAFSNSELLNKNNTELFMGANDQSYSKYAKDFPEDVPAVVMYNSENMPKNSGSDKKLDDFNDCITISEQRDNFIVTDGGAAEMNTYYEKTYDFAGHNANRIINGGGKVLTNSGQEKGIKEMIDGV